MHDHSDFRLRTLAEKLKELESRLSQSFEDWETVHLARIVVEALARAEERQGAGA